MAVSGQGKIMWVTPQAQQSLSDIFPTAPATNSCCRKPTLQWLDEAQKGKAGTKTPCPRLIPEQ